MGDFYICNLNFRVDFKSTFVHSHTLRPVTFSGGLEEIFCRPVKWSTYETTSNLDRIPANLGHLVVETRVSVTLGHRDLGFNAFVLSIQTL